MFNKKSLIFAVIVLGTFALMIGFFISGLGKNPQLLPSVVTGKPLPVIDRPALEGNTRIHNKDLPQGKPYLLNIWGSWCPACLAEHPYLVQLQQEIPIVGVNWPADNPNEQADGVRFLAQHGNPYRIIMTDPDGTLITDLGVYGAPETFLIDAQGRILLRHAGPLSADIWQQKFLPLLESTP